MEDYTNGVFLDGLDRGLFEWSGVLPWESRGNFAGVNARDNLESYSDGADVDGLNGGVDWTGAFAARDLYTGPKGLDNFESYSDGASLDGLNGGSGWTAAWIGR